MNNDILPGFDNDTSDSLAIELQKMEGVDNCLAFKLRGQIDTYSALCFQRRVRKAIEAGFANLIFLFNDVDYVSSMGVGALLQLQNTVREKGGDIALVDVPPKIMEIFKLMCLEKLFSCTESPEQAVGPLRDRRTAAVFPRALDCPICEKRLRVVKSGRFRCPECKTVLVIDETGTASNG